MKNHNKSSLVLALLMLFLSTSVIADLQAPIRFGVMSIGEPARVHAQWAPFVNYLKQKTGRDIELVVPRGFAKIKEAIANGEVDFFETNSHVFYKLQKEGKALPVAQTLNLNNSIYSRSEFFVRKDSPIKTLQDLKGHTLAFVSPMGAGGYLAPRAYLHKNGVDTEKDIKSVFTKNLSNSIHQVLLKEMDSATMCGLNYKLLSKKIDTGELRIIGTSDDYPENILGAHPAFSNEDREKITDVIVNMHNDAQGREVLKAMEDMKVKDFVKYNKEVEVVTEKLLREANMM